MLTVCVSVYLGCYLLFVFISPLPYKAMDFDKNGMVELSETFTAIDIGKRNIIINDKTCREYFFFKDGISASSNKSFNFAHKKHGPDAPQKTRCAR